MALQQYLLEGSDEQTANAANTGASQITLNGGSAVFSAAKAFSGITGVKFSSLANNLAIGRFMAAGPSKTMALTFGVTVPETQPSVLVWVASLRNATGRACAFTYTSDKRLSLIDRTGSAGGIKYLLTNVEPGTKLRIAMCMSVDTATTGSYSINIYSDQSSTPLNGTPLTAGDYDFGTDPIVGGDFGVLSSNVPSAVVVGIDDIQFNDGSTTEIPAHGATSDPVNVATQDLAWTGTEWR